MNTKGSRLISKIVWQMSNIPVGDVSLLPRILKGIKRAILEACTVDLEGLKYDKTLHLEFEDGMGKSTYLQEF